MHILDSLDDILPTELDNISELEMQPMPQRDNESRSDTDSVQSLNHPDRVSDAQEPSETEFTWSMKEKRCNSDICIDLLICAIKGSFPLIAIINSQGRCEYFHPITMVRIVF